MAQQKTEEYVHDLEKLLDRAAGIIKTASFYRRPTISWTKEFPTWRFAEYQYGINHIFVSRLLNSTKVSEDAVLAIICHELQHQEYPCEEDNEAALSKLPHYSVYQKHVKDIGEFVSENGNIEGIPGMNPVELKGNLLVCLVPFEEMETAYNSYGNYVYISSQLPQGDVLGKKMSNFSLVVLVTYYKEELWVIGWCKNSSFYSKRQKIRHTDFGTYDVTYQMKCRQKDFYRLPPGNCWQATGEESPQEIHTLVKDVSRNGFAVLDDTHIFTQYSLTEIDGYPHEFEPIGLPLEQTYALSPILETDPMKIVERSKNILKKYSFTAVWLANKAVSLEISNETMLNLAQVFHYASFIDDALVYYKRTLALNPESQEALLGYLQTLIMLERKDDAICLAQRMRSECKGQHTAAWNSGFKLCLKHLKLM